MKHLSFVFLTVLIICSFCAAGCEIISKPEPPVVNASNDQVDQITLTWNDVDGAVRYDVYKSQECNGTYNQIGTLTAGNTSYVDSSVSGGETAFYKVCAVSKNSLGLGWSDCTEGRAICEWPNVECITPCIDSFANRFGMTFNHIPPGQFLMGSPENEPGRDYYETQHQVTLTKDFYLQTTEVTQKQWRDVVQQAKLGNIIGEGVLNENPSYPTHVCENCPVDKVSWDDIQIFINALNKLSDLNEGHYSLPTEAQWEYAARAGSNTAFANGDITVLGCENDPNLTRISWYCGNADGLTHEVAQLMPNAWCLYDMHGNVSEWCFDLEEPYPTESVVDPIGTKNDYNYKVIRGGSALLKSQECRSAKRSRSTPDLISWLIGFRLKWSGGESLPVSTVCKSNDDCLLDSNNQYCKKNSGDCNGIGVCTPRPVVCPDIYAPVCGCDGKTYDNGCEAEFSGVNVDFEGECLPVSIVCNSNEECISDSVDMYCKKELGDCSGIGECTPKPLSGICYGTWASVCGCNGNTYANECYAAFDSVNVAYDGECKPSGTCLSNEDCTQSVYEYCQKSPGDCYGTGVCAERPGACFDVWEPVIGCDGETYSNDCYAASAGVNISY